MCLGKVEEDNSSIWALDIHLGDLDESSVSWLWPDLALAIAFHLGSGLSFLSNFFKYIMLFKKCLTQ